jgi:hypothetical protein
MSTISSYQNGSTAHTPNGGVSMHERAKRQAVTGWTKETVRRHTKWLYSVNTEDLTGNGYAVTLTLRDCPESAERFHSARRSWLRRLERADFGLIRAHWVIEWQRRGTPHLHTAVYFDRELTPKEKFWLVDQWIAVAEPFGALHLSQYLLPITGAAGWLQYLSKHAARGAAHYQRQGKPAGWEKTGRLWGHTGAWPEEEPMRFDVPQAAFFRYRRLVRSWRLADARSESDPVTRARRVRSARGMLRCNDRTLSEVRGISEWIDQGTLLGFLALLAGEGYAVQQIAE